MPAPAPPPVVPAAPPIALPADPRVAQLEAGFQAAHRRDAGEPFEKALAALNQNYLGALTRARAAAQGSGNLDLVTALDEERTRLESGQGPPPADTGGTPAALIQLRSTHRATSEKLRADRDRAAAPLYDKYVAALDLYVTELTRANAIDRAREIRSYRETIAARRAELEVPTAGVAQAKAPASQARETGDDGSAKGIRSSRWFEAAQWVVSSGGTVEASRDGQPFLIATEKDIPNGRFEIHGVTIAANPKSAGVTDDDFSRLAPLKELRAVRVEGLPVSDAAFAFARTTPALDSLSVIGAEKITGALFDHMASIESLRVLQLLHCASLTGAGLEKLASLPRLEEITLSYSGLNDAGMTSLAGAASVKSLNIGGTPVTDAGLAPLAALGKLETLALDGCPRITGVGFGALAELSSFTSLRWTAVERLDPGALAAIARCRSLTTLVIESPTLIDRDLAALAPLANLTSLGFNKTRITGTGFQAFGERSGLRSLDLSLDAPITAEGLLAIVAAFPDLESFGVGLGAALQSADFHPLGSLTALRSLRIGVPAFDDASLESLLGWERLGTLDLTGTTVTGAGLAPLRSARNLTFLNLTSCPKVDDAAIPILKEMSTLREVFLSQTGVTDAGVADLKAALPAVNLVR